MTRYTKSKMDSEVCISSSNEIDQFRHCIEDLLQSKDVLSMNQYIQHNSVTCLEHCIHVSYISYRICKALRLDYRSAARGGLLHDLFLYDWHNHNQEGWHGFRHAKIALENATRLFLLNEIEKDIIEKHMWPLNRKMPRFSETAVVVFVDKYCAVKETLIFGSDRSLSRLVKRTTDLEFSR